MEKHGFACNSCTYHDHWGAGDVKRFAKKKNFTARYVRDREDLVADHQQLDLTILLQPKVWIRGTRHAKIPAYSLAMHLQASEVGAEVLYIVRSVEHSFDFGLWINRQNVANYVEAAWNWESSPDWEQRFISTVIQKPMRKGRPKPGSAYVSIPWTKARLFQSWKQLVMQRLDRATANR